MVASLVDENIAVDERYWLLAGEAAVRAFCRWHVAPVVEETLIVDTEEGSSVVLPTLRILEVSKVVFEGENITDRIVWSAAGIIGWRRGQRRGFSETYRGLEVTLRHGYEPVEVPQIVALVASVGRRAADQKLVASQSVNGASVSYLSAGGAPLSVPLLSIEKEMLAPYRLPGGITP